MEKFWNERYANEEFAYGNEPNEFFKSVISTMKVGKILLPGDGEGRNGVFAGTLGWDVHAFDQSSAGRDKALKLASDKAVSIKYDISNTKEFSGAVESYDAIAMVFLHLIPVERYMFHDKLIKLLKPGGYIFMEAFSSFQLGNKSGGPDKEDLLYKCSQIAVDFEDFYIEQLCNARINLNEGSFHQGEAEVLRFVGRKI